jgi:hypothetical protein
MSVTNYRTKECRIPEGSNLHSHSRENAQPRNAKAISVFVYLIKIKHCPLVLSYLIAMLIIALFLLKNSYIVDYSETDGFRFDSIQGYY